MRHDPRARLLLLLVLEFILVVLLLIVVGTVIIPLAAPTLEAPTPTTLPTGG